MMTTEVKLVEGAPKASRCAPEKLCGTTEGLRSLAPGKTSRGLKMPSLDELLALKLPERQHLLYPWLREQESCMVYAATGAGKSLFALSLALAVAGGGKFLGWRVDEREGGWKVLYVDGEMHTGDIQERARTLLRAGLEVDAGAAGRNLKFLPRQFQEPEEAFPLITEEESMEWVLRLLGQKSIDLVILDNFSTLGEVVDENAASSFTAIQQFLLRLKTAGVATVLVHHAGKNGDFRGSSKLAATFETIACLERLREDSPRGEAEFRVCWDKVRAGGPGRTVREVVAKLTTQAGDGQQSMWEYEECGLERLDDLRAKLEHGDFASRSEAARYYGVSPPMVTKYLAKGTRLGLWTERDIRYWVAHGKRLRKLGKREAPLALATLDEDWDSEPADDEDDF